MEEAASAVARWGQPTACVVSPRSLIWSFIEYRLQQDWYDKYETRVRRHSSPRYQFQLMGFATLDDFVRVFVELILTKLTMFSLNPLKWKAFHLPNNPCIHPFNYLPFQVDCVGKMSASLSSCGGGIIEWQIFLIHHRHVCLEFVMSSLCFYTSVIYFKIPRDFFYMIIIMYTNVLTDHLTDCQTGVDSRRIIWTWRQLIRSLLLWTSSRVECWSSPTTNTSFRQRANR